MTLVTLRLLAATSQRISPARLPFSCLAFSRTSRSTPSDSRQRQRLRVPIRPEGPTPRPASFLDIPPQSGLSSRSSRYLHLSNQPPFVPGDVPTLYSCKQMQKTPISEQIHRLSHFLLASRPVFVPRARFLCGFRSLSLPRLLRSFWSPAT